MPQNESIAKTFKLEGGLKKSVFVLYLALCLSDQVVVDGKMDSLCNLTKSELLYLNVNCKVNVSDLNALELSIFYFSVYFMLILVGGVFCCVVSSIPLVSNGVAGVPRETEQP